MMASISLFFLFFPLIIGSFSHGWVIETSSLSTTSRRTRTLLFAQQQQPAFRQNHFTAKQQQNQGNNNKRIPNRKDKNSGSIGSDSHLSSLHQERIRSAGRVGTKRYINPCKVFLGNLPYQFTDAMLVDWVVDQMGLPAAVLIHDSKVIKDWKTGQSKGYGFVVFTQPIHATVCIDKCEGKMLDGRRLTVRQGKKKDDETLVYLKEKKEKPIDADERAIQDGIQIAEEQKEEHVVLMDPEELAILKRLDPDLFSGLDYKDDVDEYDYDDDDGDENNEGSGMNRSQRREAARSQKRKKRPKKGFGV